MACGSSKKLLTSIVPCTTVPHMATVAKNTGKPNITIRPTQEDKKLVALLQKKLGVDTSQIFRLAIRALATKENVTA